MADNMCRVCLCGDRRMYSIRNTELQEMWEKLTHAEFNTNDGRPCLVCYICCEKLRKCSQLRQTALKAEDLLTVFFNNGLKQSQATISLIARLTNDFDSMCFYKQLYQFECKQIEGNTVEEIQEENVEEDIYISIKEEDSYQEENLDGADVESDKICGDDALLTSTILKEILQREVRIVLERIDIEAPARKGILNEAPQKAKQINLGETTEDNFFLASAVNDYDYTPTVKSPSENLSVSMDVRNVKSGPDANLNCGPVNKISPRGNILPDDNSFEPENVFLQKNTTHTSICCYNKAESEIFKQCLPKSAEAVAPDTSTDGNTSNVFNRQGPENELLHHTHQYKSVTKSEINKHLPKHIGEKPYLCELCNKRFSRKDTLKYHIKYKHTEVKNFSCNICQYKCVTKSEIKRHLPKHVEKLYLCELCNKRFSRKDTLKYHIKYKHTKEKNFSCHICQYKCVAKSALNRHLRKHTGEKLYSCELCNSRFTEKVNLNSHIKYKHTKEKKFSCHICQYKCVRKENLNRHLRKHTGKKPYTCEICDYRCAHKYHLISHIKHKHTEEKNFSCHLCQYKCVAKGNLNNHLRTHDAHNVEKPFICDSCDYRCSDKRSLERHIKHKHTKEKNFSCHICQYKYVAKSALNRHLRKHTEEKTYTCEICDYRCAHKYHLNNHIKRKHTEEKNFSCHICYYTCVRKGNFKTHLRKHTGEKPYTCEICDYRGAHKCNLISHIKHKHTKEKNFSCHLCQYKCVEKGNLNKHLRTHDA